MGKLRAVRIDKSDVLAGILGLTVVDTAAVQHDQYGEILQVLGLREVIEGELATELPIRVIPQIIRVQRVVFIDDVVVVVGNRRIVARQDVDGTGVFVGVLVGVFVGVLVGVFVGVLVGVFVGVLVGVGSTVI